MPGVRPESSTSENSDNGHAKDDRQNRILTHRDLDVAEDLFLNDRTDGTEAIDYPARHNSLLFRADVHGRGARQKRVGPHHSEADKAHASDEQPEVGGSKKPPDEADPTHRHTHPGNDGHPLASEELIGCVAAHDDPKETNPIKDGRQVTGRR